MDGMNRTILGLLVIWMVMAGLELQGKSYYNTAANEFGGLYPNLGMKMAGRYRAIVDDRLVEENVTSATAITLDTMGIISTAYRYQVRLANLNNKQGKTRSIKDPLTGAKTVITAPQWGVVFNKDDSGTYCAVVLSCDNSTPFEDILDQRTMYVSVIKNDHGRIAQLASTTLTSGVSLEDELNTVSIDVGEQAVHISMGKDELVRVLEVPVTRPVGTVRVGYLVGAGSRVSIERAVLTIENDKQVTVASRWTLDELDQYLSSSTDPIEGYWKYLDRDMEEKWLRLGGRYTLAVVRADDGYDLLYIDGAQVKKSQWHPCMVKGHITKTQFSGNYDLRWIDATMEPIGEDAYATVENGVILTLNFPIYKSQVRFAKGSNK